MKEVGDVTQAEELAATVEGNCMFCQDDAMTTWCAVATTLHEIFDESRGVGGHVDEVGRQLSAGASSPKRNEEHATEWAAVFAAAGRA